VRCHPTLLPGDGVELFVGKEGVVAARGHEKLSHFPLLAVGRSKPKAVTTPSVLTESKITDGFSRSDNIQRPDGAVTA